MIKLFRNVFFYYIDLILPDRIRSLPYELAIKTLKIRIQKLDGIEVWHRNSFRTGNYVFGLSDLDVTVLTTKDKYFQNAKAFTKIFRTHKYWFPFLGETNFYLKELIEPIAPCLNYYERVRDPELSGKISNNYYKNYDVEKIVFILRMIYADREKLGKTSFIRQKKWKSHFREMDYQVPKIITKDYIIAQLLKTLNLPYELEQKTRNAIDFLLSNAITEHNIHTLELPEFWKYLFPHKHVWFGKSNEESFNIIHGTILEDVCIRQFDWEVWGLMSQLPFLPNIEENLIVHLARQGRASVLLNGQTNTLVNIEKINDIAEDFKNVFQN